MGKCKDGSVWFGILLLGLVVDAIAEHGGYSKNANKNDDFVMTL